MDGTENVMFIIRDSAGIKRTLEIREKDIDKKKGRATTGSRIYKAYLTLRAIATVMQWKIENAALIAQVEEPLQRRSERTLEREWPPVWVVFSPTISFHSPCDIR